VLGEVAVRERPFDLHAQLTLAIARNFLDDFAAARPLLEQLRSRMPDQPIVAYHLGWACLALGDGAAAVAQFEAAALRLPLAWVAVPRAIARFTAGDDKGLADLLVELEDAARAGRGPVHEVRRMQAAAALLAGRQDEACRVLLADLHWLLQNPSALERCVGEFAEQGAVLVRLGGGDELPPLLAALQGQQPSTPLADACAFLSGMVEVARSGRRATAVEATLSHGGDSSWSALLAAFAHELRGETLDMQTELARAARLSDSPMTKALLARSLRAVGRTAEAESLQQAVRRELLAIHLRRPPQHPLLGPELAFAFRAQ
jgi:tetratricopeptide (TPR) repeat protein